jgi:hypothetical protein
MPDKCERTDHTCGDLPAGNQIRSHNVDEGPLGDQLRDELESISARVERLDRALSSLPYVAPDGGSECPFAEQLFFQKEEQEQTVAHDVDTLRRHLRRLEYEIGRCRGNLEQIQADGGTLKLKEASEHYSQATEVQQRELEAVIDDRDAVLTVLMRAEAVLKVSRTRKFPGREPREQYPFPAPTPGVPSSGRIQPAPSGLGSELGKLLSLGPLASNGGEQE